MEIDKSGEDLVWGGRRRMTNEDEQPMLEQEDPTRMFIEKLPL
jgi:hypothetical protein